MGLDSVEIVLQTEEAFGISIPDEAAERMLTPAHLISYLLDHVPTSPSADCLSQRLFYRLRRGFRAQVPALVGDFTIDTPLDTFLHKDQWPRVWAAVRATVGESSWPESVPWPGFFSGGPKTVRHLIWHLVAAVPRPDASAGERWDRTRIEAEVRRIIRDVTGESDFRLKASFVDDIGVS